MMDVSDDKRLEATLARVLEIGTLVASVVIAIGLALQWFVPAPAGGGAAASPGMLIVIAGLAIFLTLPCVRVLLMLVAFLRGFDYRFGAVAALVLIIILVALSIGALAPAKAADDDARRARAVNRRIGGTSFDPGDRYPLLTRVNATLILCTDRYIDVSGWPERKPAVRFD